MISRTTFCPDSEYASCLLNTFEHQVSATWTFWVMSPMKRLKLWGCVFIFQSNQIAISNSQVNDLLIIGIWIQIPPLSIILLVQINHSPNRMTATLLCHHVTWTQAKNCFFSLFFLFYFSVCETVHEHMPDFLLCPHKLTHTTWVKHAFYVYVLLPALYLVDTDFCKASSSMTAQFQCS